MALSPTVRRRRLAAELRKLREGAGMTIDEAAAAADISKSALSRIENSLVGVKVPVVRALVRAYRVEESHEEVLVQLARDAAQRGWWQDYGNVVNEQLAVFVSFEAEASAIRAFETSVVPGLLQTRDYAAALFKAAHEGRSAEEIERRVAIRMTRQKRLADLHLWAIVDEAALRRYVGGPTVLRGQLEHLMEVTENKENIDFQILTLKSGAHPGIEGAFALLDFPNEADPTMIYAETPAGMMWLDKPEDVKRMTLAFDRLRAAALSPDASRDFLAKILEEIG